MDNLAGVVKLNIIHENESRARETLQACETREVQE